MANDKPLQLRDLNADMSQFSGGLDMRFNPTVSGSLDMQHVYGHEGFTGGKAEVTTPGAKYALDYFRTHGKFPVEGKTWSANVKLLDKMFARMEKKQIQVAGQKLRGISAGLEHHPDKGSSLDLSWTREVGSKDNKFEVKYRKEFD